MINKDNTAEKQIALADELATQLNICGIDEDGVDVLTVLDALSCGGLALVEGPGLATAGYYKLLAPKANPETLNFTAKRLGQSVVTNDK